MPTGVFSPIKLATDGKVDGNEPIYTFHWRFFSCRGPTAEQRRALKYGVLTLHLQKQATKEIAYMKCSRERSFFFPLFSRKPNEALCHDAVLFHPTCGELLYPPFPRPIPDAHLANIWFVNQLVTLKKKKKLKSRNKVPAHASVLTRFTLLHNFNPLILKLSGFAPLYCICSSAFGCLIKGTGRESSAVTFIADLLKACF